MTRIFFVMALALSGAAIAQTVPTDDVGQLQSAAFLKTVRAAEAEATAKLAAASPGRMEPSRTGMRLTSSGAPVASLPYFANGVAFVEVTLPEGGTILAHAGDVLPGGEWVVSSITADRAVIERAKARKAVKHAGR